MKMLTRWKITTFKRSYFLAGSVYLSASNLISATEQKSFKDRQVWVWLIMRPFDFALFNQQVIINFLHHNYKISLFMFGS